jgi:hypothetical protein
VVTTKLRGQTDKIPLVAGPVMMLFLPHQTKMTPLMAGQDMIFVMPKKAKNPTVLPTAK